MLNNPEEESDNRAGYTPGMPCLLLMLKLDVSHVPLNTPLIHPQLGTKSSNIRTLIDHSQRFHSCHQQNGCTNNFPISIAVG